MEWWSNGVMKGLFQVEIRALGFSNTPILQYSKPARNLHQQSHATMDLALWARFSITIAIFLETGERVKLICLA
jgi:hypothetical protein